MLLEKSDRAVQALGERLFAFVEQLSGSRPQLISSGDAYRAEVDGRPFIYFRFVGPRARTFPPNSVHLMAPWHDHLAGEGVRRANNWYGSQPSADFSARADNPGEAVEAEAFVRRALQVRRERGQRRA
jgi:hypothetical protein